MPPFDLVDRTLEFACAAVAAHGDLTRRGGAGRALAGQFLDAATSVGANVQEAQAGCSKADFIHKQTTALKEARESFYWLSIFERCHIGNAALITPLRKEANELVAILTTIVINAKRNPDR